MSSSDSLVVVSCDETDTRIDPSRFFNLSAATTKVIKTAGGHAKNVINNIHYADQSNRIGMIIVVQHTGCTTSTGDIEANVRADIRALKDSPYVRNEITIIGYKLEAETGQLREVSVPRPAQDAAARSQVLNQMEDFGPFWS